MRVAQLCKLRFIKSTVMVNLDLGRMSCDLGLPLALITSGCKLLGQGQEGELKFFAKGGILQLTLLSSSRNSALTRGCSSVG